MNLLGGWIGLILGFSALIFVHELGHFLLAKWNGVRVYVFSIGMGPYLVSFTWRGTVYALSLIPIGGYVKMMGQDDLNPNQTASADQSDYRNKRPGQRAAILAAGATFNLLFTVVLFTCCYYHGMAVEPPRIGDIPPTKPLAHAMLADPPGKPANLQRGDRICEVNGVPVKTFMEAQLEIAGAPSTKDLFLKVERQSAVRGENPVLVVVRPQMDKKLGATSIGLEPYAEREAFHLGFATSDAVVVSQDPNIKPEIPWSTRLVRWITHASDNEKLSPAAQAGFEKGDEILSVIDPGRPDSPRAIKHQMDLVFAVQGSVGRPLKIEIKRNGEPKTLDVTPELNPQTGDFMIGLASGLRQRVAEVDPQSEAYQAGLRQGDFVLGFAPAEDEKSGQLAWTADWAKLGEPDAKIQHATLAIPPEAAGLVYTEEILAEEHLQLGFFASVGMAWEDLKQFSSNVFTVLKGLFTRDVSPDALSGPVGIGKIIYKVGTSESFVQYLWLLAFLSLQLGVLQFVPIPLLDGWHLLLVLVEKIKGTPVAPKIQEAFQYVGIFLIGTLLLYVTCNDVWKYLIH